MSRQLLKGIVYTLAVKARNLIDLVIKKSVLLTEAARSASLPFVGTLSLLLFMKNVQIEQRRLGNSLSCYFQNVIALQV